MADADTTSFDPVTSSGRLYVSPDSPPGLPQQKGGGGGDPWAEFPDAPPAPKVQPGKATVAPSAPSQTATSSDDPWAEFSDKPPEAKKPARDVGTAEAGVKGLAEGLTFGAMPAVAGLSAASGIPSEAKNDDEVDLNPARPIMGAVKMLHEHFSDHPDPDVRAAYDRGRQAYLEDQNAAKDQHFLPYLAGQLGGAIAVPLPGAGAVSTGAGTLARVGRGVAGGMVGGGAYGAGTAIGEGKDTSGVVSDAAKGVATGGVLGGTIGGVLGRAAPTGVVTDADRAARTAEDLGAPLPRGVVSNNPATVATTAKMKEFPFAGERIGQRVEAAQNAASTRIGDMAEGLAGGAPTRTTVAPSAAPAVQQMVDHNNAQIDHAYDALRHEINPDQHAPMPNLQNAIRAIRQRRSRAGWQSPGEGLQQAENVANGVGHAGGFNGVHRLRRDLREAGNPQKANPGYDAGDFRYLKRAVDADIRSLVRHVSTNPNHAESLYNTAELTAGDLIRTNQQLEGLAKRHGESIVGALLNSAKEKSGNIALLREARRTMSPQSFDQLAGVMLHELGLAEGQTGEFSLARFATNWNKASDQAKALMFSPAHLAEIENIAHLGGYLKDAGKFTNSSHTGSIIVLMDVAKDAALLFHDVVQSGSLGMGTVAGAGSTLGAFFLTKWLASPKTVASMSRWTSVYRALTLNQPTPARIAAFKVATRTLANNIDIPFDRIMERASKQLSTVPAKADEPEEE